MIYFWTATLDDRPEISSNQISALDRDELAACAKRLDRLLADLHRTGKLTSGQASTARNIERRRRALRDQVNEAIRRGKFWDIVVAELRRDYGSLIENMLEAIRSVDHKYSIDTANHKSAQPQRLRSWMKH